jgi:hypothetical protein
MPFDKCYNHQKSIKVTGIVDLFFETYLILALVFIILGFWAAGPFLKSRKHTVRLSALLLFSGFFVPYFLIILQRGWGSLSEINDLRVYEWMVTENITLDQLDILRHTYDIGVPIVTIVWRCLMHHLLYVLISEVTGMAVGVLAYLFYRKGINKQP